MKLIPVIHVVDKPQVVYNLDLCRKHGIDKVALINHRVYDANELVDMVKFSKQEFPEISFGVNFLMLDTISALLVSSISLKNEVDFIWADDGLTSQDNVQIVSSLNAIENKHELYGGVAFKYQREKVSLETACKNAMTYMDVITTSGERTGCPPTEHKLKTIRELIGNFPLAVASGVDEINIGMIRKYCNFAFVSSSITDSETELIIESKLVKLINANK